ncbi:2,3-bisphosphoglycerate-independent phosphoglycerate mutase [Dictyocoela muelleri]|nr:2,3-bisphosphoglycerate-independent phosphoglycerate mutase [Dictyocoela muelleri]
MKTCLIIIDGFGHSTNQNEKNAIDKNCQWMKLLSRKYKSYLIYAHGLHVGLPDNQMGNSEVGHLTIGAGRVVLQDQVRINKIISNEQMGEYLNFISSGKRLHLIGLLSDGGVHGHIDHIKSLLRNLKDKFDDIFVHIISDGRDTSVKSVLRYIREMSGFMTEMKKGEFGSISGRFYSMDRDKNWERTMESYKMFIGEGKIYTHDQFNKIDKRTTSYKNNEPENNSRNNFEYSDHCEIKNSIEAEDYWKLVKIIINNYKNNITDEFIFPTLLSEKAQILINDTVIFTNYRADRMRQLTKIFLDKRHNIITMTEYDKSFSEPSQKNIVNGILKNISKVIFMRPEIKKTLGEVVSDAGLTQARIAETEKYAHVTYFLNGGSESEFLNEKRLMVPSPKVKSYCETPEMNMKGVVENIIKMMNSNSNDSDGNPKNDNSQIDMIIANLAAPDMVGHTGKFNETCAAVRYTDELIGLIYECCKINGYALVITADHGNAECMEKYGNIVTKHTTNKVPLIICTEERKIHVDKDWGYDDSEFSLIDVAPTVLDLLGIEKPNEMTGKSVLKD